jgi:DNA-binding response OmpR family regulator
MRVLLVDDEEELVSALAERLELRSFDTRWCTSGSEALALVESGCFDLAVLDMKMPKISGLALREKLKDRCPAMKFIILTGYGSEKDFASAAALVSEDYYLVKPVDIDVLIQKMQALFKAERGEE